MNAARSIRSFLLAFLLSPLTGAAQERPDDRPAPQQPAPLVLSLSEIVLDQYPVQNVDSDDLYELASQLVGRNYFVKERGDSGAVFSLRLLGESIVLYDTKEEVQRARQLLARLDVPPPQASSNRKTVEYKPRFISLETARVALKGTSNPNLVEERGLLVLQDDDQDIEAALALLKRIDVPEKQVLVTCQMIEVTASGQGPALPKELLDNLQKLLPQSTFTQVGLAMLKTSVGGQSPISLRIEGQNSTYLLSFTPTALDEGSGSLTITNCSLVDQSNIANSRELFRTNTILRGGEYTVLAATGAAPRLLVVRVTPQG